MSTRSPLPHASPVHGAAERGAGCVAVGSRYFVKRDLFHIVANRDQVSLAERQLRDADIRGVEAAGHLPGDQDVAVRIFDRERRSRVRAVTEVVKDRALRRRTVESLCHGVAAACDDASACDLADTAALAAVVDRVVGAAAGEADPDRAAADVNVAVGVQSVRVPRRLIDNCDRASADADLGQFFGRICGICRFCCIRVAGVRLFCGVTGIRHCCCIAMHHAAEAAHTHHAGPAVRVKSVVGRIDRDIAAGHLDLRRLDAFVALGDQHCAALDINFRVTMDAVVAGADREIRFHDPDAVVDVNAVARRRDADRPACDHELVVAFDPMLVAAGDREGAAAVDRQVIMCVDDAAGAVLDRFVRIRLAARQAVLRPFFQCEKNLVRLIHTNCRIVTAGDVHAVQHDPDFGVVVGVHDDAVVRECPGDRVFSAGGDIDAAVVDVCAAAADLRRITV